MGKLNEEFRSPMCSMEDGNKALLLNELRKLNVI